MAYDARWSGDYGIARYSAGLRPRLEADVVDLRRARAGLTPRALCEWEAQAALARMRHPHAVLLSPGFTPAHLWHGPQAITVHDLIHLDVDSESDAGKRCYYERVVRPAIRRNTVTFTVSEYSRQRIIEWSGVAPDRIVVTGNAAGPEFTPHGPAHSLGHPYLLYVRNAKPHKNTAGLVRAFAQLPPSDLRLLLSGERDRGSAMLAQSLGVADRVVYTGRIPQDDLPSYYRGAAAAVFPSLYEGFGIPAVEAMASGTPLVASTTTSLPEVVGQAAVTVDPTDNSAIADGIHRVLTDTALREKLRLEGPRRAARFTWENIAATVNTTLAQL